MRILVTGTGGYLGGAIVARLAAREADHLVSAVRRPPAPAGGIVLDLDDPTAIAAALTKSRPDVVVHAAGRVSGAASALFRDNARATANLAHALGQVAPAARLIVISSAAVYAETAPGRKSGEDDSGLPLSLYGLSKRVAESCAVAELGQRVTVLRLFNVVSASARREQMFSEFLLRACAAARAGSPPWRVAMGPLGAVRDFVALDDVLVAVERVIDRGIWGETINVCTGVGRPARDLVDAVAHALNGRLLIDEAPDGATGAAWSVGDPARCDARLALRPSADLSAILSAAADAIAREAGHARSPA